MNIRMNEDPLARNDRGIGKTYHEVLLIIKFLQSKPQIRNMNINSHDLYYIAIKNRDEKDIVDIH